MVCVMKLVAAADGSRLRHAGEYLKAFDFEAGGGVGLIDMTADVADAMTFADMAEMHSFYTRSPVCNPRREDGLPNRPLTATTWEIVTLPGGDKT